MKPKSRYLLFGAGALQCVGILWAYIEIATHFGLRPFPRGLAGAMLLIAISVAVGGLYAIGIEKLRQYAKAVVAWALAVAVGLVFVVSLTMAATISYEQHKKEKRRPYIAVVASRKSVDFPIPREFIEGFENRMKQTGKDTLATRDLRPVEIRFYEDLGNPEEAARIASDLAADSSCILAIGNSNSTLTAITLDVFLRSTDKLAFILPIASANDLMTKAKSGEHRGVLRMIPDNAAQAEAIAQITAQEAPHGRVAVYVDEENLFYSLGLSREITSQVRAAGGYVVVEQSLGPNNPFLQSVGAWKSSTKLTPELIIYVGVAHHGLLLIDQLAATGIRTPVVFTDGCMVRDLLQYVERIPNRAFVLSPVAKARASVDMPTYEPIGADAYSLASAIVSKANATDRNGVRAWLEKNKSTSELQFQGIAGAYSFNPDGDNTGMKWKVYEISRGRLVPYSR